jgi:hypothetical protein
MWTVCRWNDVAQNGGERWIELYRSIEENDCYTWAITRGLRDVIVRRVYR